LECILEELEDKKEVDKMLNIILSDREGDKE
jgi:hypothetical protein